MKVLTYITLFPFIAMTLAGIGVAIMRSGSGEIFRIVDRDRDFQLLYMIFVIALGGLTAHIIVHLLP